MIFISEIRSKIIQKNILCTNKSPMVLPKSCQFFAQTHSFFFLGGGGCNCPPAPCPPSTFHAQMVLSHLIVMVFPQTIRLDLSTLGMFVFFFTKNRCILIFSVLPPAIISQTKMCLKRYNKDLFKTSKTYTDL